jgi:WD40 repeat protein
LQHAAWANLSAWLPYLPRLKAVLPPGTVDFSPDGKQIVIGDADGRVRLWDLATSRPIGSTLQHPRDIGSVVLSPDGKQILIGSSDGTAQLWGAATGQPTGPLLRHEGQGRVKAAFSPDGKTLVTYGSDSGTVRFWDAASGRPLGEPRRYPDPPPKHVDLPLAAQLWDAATGRHVGPALKIPTPHGEMALSPDGRTLVTGASEGIVRLWDASTGQPLLLPRKGHNDWVRFVIFSPDGETFLTGSTDKTARIWDAVTGQPIGLPLIHNAAVTGAVFSRDGKLVATSADSAVRVWEVRPYQPIRLVLGHSDLCGAIAFSPDGKMILTGSRDRNVRLWDALTGQPLILPQRGHSDNILAVAFSPDGKLALTGSEAKTARIWEVPSGRPIGPLLEQGSQVTAVAFSPDGKTILTGGVDGAVRRWDAATGAREGSPVHPAGASGVLAFGPDGKTFVTNASPGGGGVRLWDLATGSPASQLYPHPGPAEVAAFSPDGKLLLTGCNDTVTLWDVATGRLVLPPITSQSYVDSLAFRADGQVFAVGNSRVPFSVQHWDVAAGQPIGPTLRHPGYIAALAFSPDGMFLLTGCQDGKARLFRQAPEMPDDLDRVANWAEVLIGMTLEPRQGTIQILDNAAWLASRARLEQRAGPRGSAWDSLAASESPPIGLAWTLSQARWDGAWEEFGRAGAAAGVAPKDEAIAAYRGPLMMAERLMAKYPNQPDYQRMVDSGPNGLAWGWATHPDTKLRDPAHAVELARMAARVAVKSASTWNTLGTALYRNGDWSGAIAALRRSNELNAKRTLGFNAYILAMAHLRRGEAAPARIWFDIAGRWHQHVAPANEELTRFRTEAAGVLGLEPGTDREGHRAPSDDATLAELVLQADPSAAWARAWLGKSSTRRNHSVGQPTDASMPNGPGAFARP